MIDTEKKWTIERVHSELYEARTKVFVIAKVLETGAISFADHPEWALVIKPMLKDLAENANKIDAMLKEEDIGEEGA